MPFDLSAIVRPNVLALKPYSTARDEFQDDGRVRVMLDANENPYDTGTNRYPDPHQHEVKHRVAHLKGVRPEQIFLGNGSDEGIDLLLRIVCRPGRDSILIQPPTYGMYEVSAGINDVGIIRVPLGAGFLPDPSAVLAAVTPETKLIFVCSPNNPTGNRISKELVRPLLDQFHGIVVVDEAYADYDPGHSWLPDLDRYPNLAVMQTFSKAWGMAGIRMGMVFASAEIIALLNKIKSPYNLSALAQKAALNGLDFAHVTQQLIQLTLQERQRLLDALPGLDCVRRVYPSDANFILAEVAGGRRAYDYLLDQGIVTRDRSSVPGLQDCLRITVGTPEENDRLLAALQVWQG